MRRLVSLSLVAATFAAVLFVLPSAASARTYEVAVGTHLQVARSPSLDALSDDDTFGMADLSLATRLLRGAPILGDIWFEAVGQLGSTSASDFDQFDAAISLHSVQLGLRGVRRLTPRISGYLRGDVGVLFGELTLSSPEAANSIQSDADALVGYAGAGIDLALLQARPSASNPDLSFGLRVEAGWLQSQRLLFLAQPDYPDDDLQHLPTSAASLGSLDPSGVALRIAIVGRF